MDKEIRGRFTRAGRSIASFLLVVLVLCAASPAWAASAVSETGDDVADLITSMDAYFGDYLPGIPQETRTALENHAEKALREDKDSYFMPMMSTLASMRKAGQSGEGEGITDVIGGFDSLSESARNSVLDNLTAGFSGIGLEVSYSAGILSFSDGTAAVAEIKLSAKDTDVTDTQAGQPSASGAPNQAMADIADGDAPAPDVTTLYLNAYIPKVTDEYIAHVKALIKTYSDDGGGPAGSGGLWRCIREIGELLGRKVDMAADYSSFTVNDEGTVEFLELSEEIREKVIEKVKEGMTSIAVTAAYDSGTFTFTKLGEVQFTYTVAGAEAPAEEQPSTEQPPTEPQTGEGGQDNSSSGTAVYIIAGVIILGVAALVIFRDKIFKK